MTQGVDEAAFELDALKCARCAYSLAGIDPAKSCPECGLAISLSMPWEGPGPDPGEYSSRIASGLGLVLGANLLGIGATAAIRLAWGSASKSIPPVLVLACILVTESVNFVGFLRLATPQRGLGNQTPGYTAARNTMILHIAAAVVLIAAGLPMLTGGTHTLMVGFGCAALPLLAIAIVLKMAFTFEAIERIDWRYRGDNYVAQTFLLFWLVSAMLVVILPMVVLVIWSAFAAWVWLIRRSVLAYQESVLVEPGETHA